MRVFVAEKPSAAKAIADVLPGQQARKDGYIEVGGTRVTWCFGHLMRLADAAEYDERLKYWNWKDLPILPDEFMIIPNASDSGYLKQLKVIERLVRDATEVVHAGDADREGHLLVQWVLNHVGCRKPTLRLWLAAQDPHEVKKALAAIKPNHEYQHLFESGQCRSFADWMVGINLSRAYSLAFKDHGSDRMISVGRVQSPTLALVVERDRLIENFVPKAFFVPWLLVSAGGVEFRARWIGKCDEMDDDGRLLDRAVAKRVVDGCTEAEVSAVKVEVKKEGPPMPYRLSTLQAKCSSKFGMTADDTLAAVQSLYEKHKMVSYPRTDCDYLPDSQHRDAPEIFKAIAFRFSELRKEVDGADPEIKSSAFNTKKVTAHHAIIPTRGHNTTASDMTDVEAQVYDLIARAYLAQFYPPHRYEATRIDLDGNGEPFRASGRVPLEPGWKAVMAAHEDADEQKDEESVSQALPKVAQGDMLPVVKGMVDQKATQAPGHYTDGALILDMENVHRVVQRKAKLLGPEAVAQSAKVVAKLKEVAGIGTEATRSALVKLLIQRGYIVRKGKKILSTPLGREVVDALPERVRSPVMTAYFEQALGEVSNGSLSPERFLEVQRDWVMQSCIEAEKKKLVVSPFKKGDEDGKKPAKKGKAPAKPKADAGSSKPVDKPKPVAPPKEVQGGQNAGMPYAGMPCPECGTGRMILRGVPPKQFLGCNRYPDCKRGIKLE